MIDSSNIQRYVLIAGGFSLAVAALVLFQPGTPSAPVAALPSAPQAPVTESTAPITEVTQVSAQLTSGNTDATQATDPALLNMTNSVLAGLGVTPEPKGPTNDLREMTSSVLQGLGVAPQQPGQAAPQNLNDLVNTQSDDAIKALLSEAIDRGLIEVPKALRTAEGQVDKATMIAQLARAASGESATPPSDDIIAGGKGVEVRVVQRANKTVQYRFYTVQAGDSLGAISHKFYGDAAEYTRIYEANRRLLPSPDQISVGQRLSIPAFEDA